MRTSTISSMSYINDRNCKRDVEEPEKAILEDLKAANKGKKSNNSFSRRITKPCMKFRAKTNFAIDSSIVPEVEDFKTILKLIMTLSLLNRNVMEVDDLYAVDKFDIDLNI